jgi:hypothetical protein
MNTIYAGAAERRQLTRGRRAYPEGTAATRRNCVIKSQSSASRVILVWCAIAADKHRLLERRPAIQRDSPAGNNRDRRDRCWSDYRGGRGHPESKLIGRSEPSRRSVAGSARPGRSCAVV